MSNTSHDILDLLPEPHRTLAKQRRADAAREAQTPNSDIPRHLRLALASATRAFQSGDLSTLGTANEDLQPLLDAAIAWGRRQGKNTPDLITAPVEGVDVEEVLRLDREATPGPWRAVGASIRVTLPGGIEYQWATASYPRDTALMVNYRTAAPALAREVQRLRAEIEELRRAEAAALFLPEGGADLGFEVWSEGWVKQVGERDEYGETKEEIVIEDFSACAHPDGEPYRRCHYRRGSLIAVSFHRSPRAAMKAGT